MSPVPGGVSIQEIVDARPISVLNELGDGLLHHESTPHECLILVGEQTHGQQLDPIRPPTLRSSGCILPPARLDIAMNAQ